MVKFRHVAVALAVAAATVGVGAAQPAYAATECNGFTPAVINDDVVVPSGAFCYMFNTVVRGDVTVQPGGNLDTKNSTIHGSITAQNPYGIGLTDVTVVEDLIVNRTQGGGGYFICSSEIRGTTSIRYSSPGNRWAIGEIQVCGAFAGGNTFGEGVTFLANRNRVVFEMNTARDDVTATDNTGSGQITNNEIGGDLVVRRNNPCYTVGSNVVRGSETVVC